MRKKQVILFLVVIVVLVGGAYSPTLLYFAHVSGVEIARPELGRVYFELEKWWFPIKSPGSILDQVLGGQKKETVVFIRTRGMWPGTGGTIVVSQIPGWEITRNATKLTLAIGDVYDVTDATDLHGQRHFVVKQHNLLVTTDSLESIYAIRAVRKE